MATVFMWQVMQSCQGYRQAFDLVQNNGHCIIFVVMATVKTLSERWSDLMADHSLSY
jgi:hypothetical protein